MLAPDNEPLNLVSWLGASGTRYEFQLHPIGTMYHERAGVYIFCRAMGNGRWAATYIGETDNFQRRLSLQLTTHHKWQRVVSAGATHLCTLHVPGILSYRETIETDLRRAIAAPCNDQ